MLSRKTGFKSAQTRFSLLLLEDGEFFLDVRPLGCHTAMCTPLFVPPHAVVLTAIAAVAEQDFSVLRYLDPVPTPHRYVGVTLNKREAGASVRYVPLTH